MYQLLNRFKVSGRPNLPPRGLWHHRIMNKIQDTPVTGFTFRFTASEHKIECSKDITKFSIFFTAKQGKAFPVQAWTVP
jgi:hypothetical protein